MINTHHHGDHTFGNYLFAGATIVGHERDKLVGAVHLAAGQVLQEYRPPRGIEAEPGAPTLSTYAAPSIWTFKR